MLPKVFYGINFLTTLSIDFLDLEAPNFYCELDLDLATTYKFHSHQY